MTNNNTTRSGCGWSFCGEGWNEGTATMTVHNTHERIAERLHTIEWQITDARQVLKQAAANMMRRAIEATASCEALMNNEPCSLAWTEFAEGDLRLAKEARQRLERLIEIQRVLKNVTGG